MSGNTENVEGLSMPKGSNQRFKLSYLKNIMLEETDAEHTITMPDIISLLEKSGVSAERKSLYNDIADLTELGVKIKGYQKNKSYYYQVEEREFSLPELKLLVDAIQSSKFITERKSRELIKKLENYASRYERKKLHRQVFVHGRVKTMNEGIYQTVDAIHSAISDNRKIKFKYLKWNVNKKLEQKKNGEWYVISPWALMWDDDNYYLVAYDSEAGKIKHYRVDKMSRISVTEDAREGLDEFKNCKITDYSTKNFGMFGGREETVTIEIENEMIGVFFDRFGTDIFVSPIDEKHSRIRVNVAVSEQFYGWIFALGTGVRITGPESVREDLKGMAERIHLYYGNN